MRLRIAALVTLLCGAVSGPAVAQPRPQRVAVLPLVADGELAIYSKPAADALARGLSNSGARVESLSLSGDVPDQVALVIDGRIARAGDDLVVLEARIRDPRRARIAVDTVATDPRPLAEIDRLADELAAALTPRLASALAELERRIAAEREARANKKVLRLAESPRGGGASPPPAAAVADRRPAMLVYQATGEQARILTPHAYWLAERLGHRPVAGDTGGMPRRDTVIADARRVGAAYALVMQLRRVHFVRGGVLSARGRVRVMLVDARGRVLFDKTARTDTVVGSRGDGNAALLHYVGEQAVEIVTPHLRRLLGLPL